MIYSLIRRFLFLFPAEASHNLALKAIRLTHRVGLLSLFTPAASGSAVKVMGIEFPNPVGLAAGLDKNADYIDCLAALGFGFIEVGTVTPRPQSGNPKPRLFRLPRQHAIINRMGFNNKGVDHLVERVKACRYRGVLGINIGKNADTPVANALDDYLICMRKVYPLASYITINISSPNTPGLRDLQFGASLRTLLAGLKREQSLLKEEYGRYVPLAVKIAPDMSPDEIATAAAAFIEHKIDAVIATNTSLGRRGVESEALASQAGGLSGAPIAELSNATLAYFAEALAENIPLIGVGGIMDAAGAKGKFDRGARLVQLYTGFIYRGPRLIGEIRRLLPIYQDTPSSQD